MVVVRAAMRSGRGQSRTSMSLVLDSGEIHHFFALHDGVHHSWTGRFRGRFDDALRYELRRPHAEIVDLAHANLRFLDPLAGEPTEALAS